jgi:hypothetical protein
MLEEFGGMVVQGQSLEILRPAYWAGSDLVHHYLPAVTQDGTVLHSVALLLEER